MTDFDFQVSIKDRDGDLHNVRADDAESLAFNLSEMERLVPEITRLKNALNGAERSAPRDGLDVIQEYFPGSTVVGEYTTPPRQYGTPIQPPVATAPAPAYANTVCRICNKPLVCRNKACGVPVAEAAVKASPNSNFMLHRCPRDDGTRGPNGHGAWCKSLDGS